MHFLIDASLPRDTAIVMLRHGHVATDVRDIGLRHATDSEIAKHAQRNRLALISADFDFADIRLYAPKDYYGLCVIDRPEDAKISEVLDLIEGLLLHRDLLANLIGRLVIVNKTRMRIRPSLP